MILKKKNLRALKFLKESHLGSFSRVLISSIILVVVFFFVPTIISFYR